MWPMGNNSAHNDLDELLVGAAQNVDFDYQQHLINVLERMVSRGSLTRYCSMKMPVIRKRPDLGVFKNTVLFREVKLLSGLPADNKLPRERWSLERLLRERENGTGARPAGTLTGNECRRIANMYIPNNKEQRLMSLESKVFCGTLNKSGSRLITASQDNIIRVFDASRGTYHRINRITARDVSWCILDIDYSPDGEHFVYSTWSDYLHIAPIAGRVDVFQWLHLNPDHSRSCVFSVRFSPRGDFLIGGANDGCIYVYDRGSDTRTSKIKTDGSNYTDINAVEFIEPSSNLFVSGCDNGIIKLWDLRCLGSRHSPIYIFVGHYDGVTYIDSRNDGRYILSNSKDQSIKIWDLRKPSPKEREYAVRNMRILNWDYRWDNVPREFYNPTRDMEGDSSVMTYRGHRVTKSLIRAKFSPAEQTGQRYIYTGCGTGRVIIYDVLTGHIKEAIEGHKDVVRDVAWHPVRSEIVSSSWDSHVNLNTYKRTNDVLRRRNSGGGRRRSGEDDTRPLRRSRRIALRNTRNHDSDEELECF